MINNSFFVKFRHIHFVGVGGISMSALAKLCFSRGVFVSGSDKTKSNITDELTHLGLDIHIGHKKSNIKGADLVVYTCAVGEDNIEVKTAKEQGVLVFERADFLGKLSKEFKNVVAIAGSHGKTTVCALVGKIFNKAGLNPTILVGGESEANGNLVIGDNNYLIVEACEYKRHFLKLKHDVSVILNIDYDHPDCYKNALEYAQAFEEFANTTTKQNIVLEKYKMFLNDSNATTYGKNGNFTARHIRHFEDRIEFDAYKNQKFYQKFVLNMIGEYNVLNALCAITVSDFFGIDKDIQQKALKEFQGIKRRYEYMGKLNSNFVIADYAHHPTQIANCIQATKKVYGKKVVAVYEPHTFTRTKALFYNFVTALSSADEVILLPTYSAREKLLKGGTSKDLYGTLLLKAKKVSYIKTYDKCFEELKKATDSVILILGAGSVYSLAEQIKHNYLHN
ncbi:MAG: UDP-N-acetylmuramate--L-alanine ligase [Christensenellales bacterium]